VNQLKECVRLIVHHHLLLPPPPPPPPPPKFRPTACYELKLEVLKHAEAGYCEHNNEPLGSIK
jgi:hypothetical protein